MTDEQAEELITAVKDMRVLLRLGLAEEIGQLRQSAFDGDARKEDAYELLAKGESYRSIGDAVGVSHATVGKWTQHWKDLGLVDEQKRCRISPELLRNT